MKKLFLSLCFLIALNLATDAQSNIFVATNIFGIDSTHCNTFHFNKFDEQNAIDSSIDNFHLYHPTQSEALPFYYDLGNLGQPTFQFYQFNQVPFGFGYFMPTLNNMRFDFDNQVYYNTYHNVYSELKYIVGLKNENLLEVFHAQNINRNFSFQAHYRYVNSDGTYTHQTTKNQNLFFNIGFVSNNERFHSQVGYLYNQFRFQQNGGVTTDSVYENNYINKSVVPVVLQSAYTRAKDDGWQIVNSYDFGKRFSKKINDTTYINHYVPFIRLQHSLLINHQYLHSADDAFTPTNYLPANIIGNVIDTFGNYDSLINTFAIHTYSNQFNVLLMPYKALSNDTLQLRKVLVQLGLEHQFVKLNETFSMPNQLQFHNINLIANIHNNQLIKSKFNYGFDLNYCATGYLANTYKAVAYASLKIFRQHIFSAQTISQNYYNTNYLIYLNPPTFQFQPFNQQSTIADATTKMNSAQLSYALPKHHFSISFTESVFQNFIYFNNNAQLVASNRTIYQPYLELKKDFVFHHWHWNNLLNYNTIQNSEIPMPATLYRGQLYYERHYFKRALFMQIGIQLNYFDKYFASQWLPVYAVFYNQQINFGAQQNWQFFINAKVKQVRIFLKMDNLTQGIDGHGNYVGKYYPLPDRSFKFGISWSFFDQ